MDQEHVDNEAIGQFLMEHPEFDRNKEVAMSQTTLGEIVSRLPQDHPARDEFAQMALAHEGAKRLADYIYRRVPGTPCKPGVGICDTAIELLEDIYGPDRKIDPRQEQTTAPANEEMPCGACPHWRNVDGGECAKYLIVAERNERIECAYRRQLRGGQPSASAGGGKE